MSSPRLFRVLCLPGYTQNGMILRKKTGALRKTLKSVAELEYIDPPILMPVPEEGPEELKKKIGDQLLTEDEKPYAWFFRQADGSCKGLEEALDYLFALLDRQGPFDAIFGFSQGFRFEDALTLPYYDSSPTHCPTLHILGKQDTLIDPERSHALASLFPKAEVYEHKGGHVMPSDSAGRKTVLAFLQSIPQDTLADKEICHRDGCFLKRHKDPRPQYILVECAFDEKGSLLPYWVPHSGV
ncbi:serine hydrolase-domain-containing protein [Piptocephalis cylindrospora]|uniref:Serine hydrolase-domain-containing protein n=1 Tax=Piptocephalis cylindrospora TaxID=1907219 RepID=A0A4P9Y6D5_9FUNG|nr:serine hydrolase-domain-containing protein [Piptocephalis cylindrospora]|eukprot:RKP14638.1 serine hydrolase-domain-containing protein [Piptocephalis cylindrospora]